MRPGRAVCSGAAANRPTCRACIVTLLQYASFDVFSDVFNPDQVSEVLGLRPSRVSWRGSRQSADPVIPRTNVWSFQASGVGHADDQIRQLLDRFEALADRLQTLTTGGASTCSISLVRYFDSAEASAEYLARDEGRRFDGVSITGFHLDLSLLRRLADLGWPLDVDEYDEYDAE